MKIAGRLSPIGPGGCNLAAGKDGKVSFIVVVLYDVRLVPVVWLVTRKCSFVDGLISVMN